MNRVDQVPTIISILPFSMKKLTKTKKSYPYLCLYFMDRFFQYSISSSFEANLGIISVSMVGRPAGGKVQIYTVRLNTDSV